MTPETLSQIVDSLPHNPGVYQFYNLHNEILYIGKAKDLRKRVSSYFNRVKNNNAKLRILVSKIHDIKHIVVDTESDALLLENNLIKKHQPKYNVLLKDDKTYPWICIKNEPFPRVFSTRRVINDGSMYFGPYTSGVVLKTILDLIRSLYPLRTCSLNLTQKNIASGKFNSCLEFQIGNCKAPCIGNQGVEEYNNNIKQIVDLLRGNIHSVKRGMIKQMKEFANEYRFEEAQDLKVKLEALEHYQAKSSIVSQSVTDLDVFSIANEKNYACVNYLKIIKGSVIQSHNIELKKSLDESEEELLGIAIAEIRQRVSSNAKQIVVPIIPEFNVQGARYIVPVRGDKHKLLILSLRNAKAYIHAKKIKQEKQDPNIRLTRKLETLKADFKTKELPKHIECFDNSNTQGTNPVSACVVFKNTKPAKKEYRLFNIKTVQGPNDYASMQEAVRRRYSRVIAQNEALPQLIVIDGGKGQLSASYAVLKELGIEQNVQIIGIAERLEEIFFYGDPVPLYLDKNSESLKIIQQARNEAHRFGITHHRNRRSKSFLQSELTDIKGIGNVTAQTLLKKFKNIEAIANSSAEELTAVIGSSKAKIVREHFRLQRPKR
ncbi:MAG TPA: excinuclease ABC subunit C [Bacteroidales bacterium]|jgi:excinuclease ABC subunit C|nr:excinuclease ABC subunit C [Bacteroidales bacterium]